MDRAKNPKATGPFKMGTPTLGDTVGSLLAAIATALQDALRILMFADKRGWGPDEFEQVRAVEEALDEAKRDFQSLGPLVNGQFYYENDRKPDSLKELGELRRMFDEHTQVFRDWVRSGGPINPLWVRETVSLRHQLHRAQCRAARRIFNAEHEAGDGSGSGTRCLGAFLVYRQLREQAAVRTQAQESQADPTHEEEPIWKQQQPQLRAREQRRFAGQELFRGRKGYDDVHGEELEMTPQTQAPRPTPSPQTTQPTQLTQPTHPPLKSALKYPSQLQIPSYTSYTSQTKQPTATSSIVASDAHTTIPLRADEPPSPPPRPPTLEDLVPECNKVGTFERFGDRDIAFICDFCDGHIVWEDVQRLPTTRAPPAGVSSDGTQHSSHLSSTLSRLSPLPTPIPFLNNNNGSSSRYSQQHMSSSSPSPAPHGDGVGDGDADIYPRWQATTTAMSNRQPRTVVFAPLAIANHLPPLANDWEARLWCPYCDDYLYYDSSEGAQTKYAQDEYGFASLAEFQEHLEWHHTALPLPALPVLPKTDSCALM